jgi:hypothetical protein
MKDLGRSIDGRYCEEAPQHQSAIIVARGFGMKSRQGYKGYVIEARSCELKEGGFSAEFSVEEHDGSGVSETQFYLSDTFPTQESAIKAAIQAGRQKIDGKRLTNTPVRQAGPVLKCPDDRKSRVVSAQAPYPCGSSAVGGRVCEQRYAPQRVLPESRFELQHTGSPSQETALEEKA